MEMFLFVILLVAIVFITMPKASDKVANGKPSDGEKHCPPHKWEYLEILDHRGVSTGQRMVCATCQSTPGDIAGREE